MEHNNSKNETYTLFLTRIRDTRDWVKYKTIDILLGEEIENEILGAHLNTALQRGDLIVPKPGYVCAPELANLYPAEQGDSISYEFEIPF